jgi:hypothetical protein
MNNLTEHRETRTWYQPIGGVFGWLIEVLVSIVEDDNPALLLERNNVKKTSELAVQVRVEPGP